MTPEIKELVGVLIEQSIQSNKAYAFAFFSLFCFSATFHFFAISANWVSPSNSWPIIPAEIAFLSGSLLSFVHMRQWIRTLKKIKKS